jgi:hypothetical protein
MAALTCEDRLGYRSFCFFRQFARLAPSDYCSEQGPDACRQSHCECTPESHA